MSGYIALSIMGITLGFFGAGGSILTIPILIYLFEVPIYLATTYSFLIVGSTSLIAAVMQRNNIIFTKAMLFLIPSIIGVFGARYFIIPSLPQYLGEVSLQKILILLLLSFMSLGGYFMIKKPAIVRQKYSISYSKIVVVALILGTIIGILGAGGGFLIIPSLLMMGFKIHEAVATSLFIITLNSFIGFNVDKHHLKLYEWLIVGKYLICAILGMFLGLQISKSIKTEVLQKLFGYFILIIATTIFTKEFIL